MSRSGSIFLCCLLALLACDVARADDSLAQFVKSHCVDCHSGDAAEADLDLAVLLSSPMNSETVGRWVSVHDRVADGEMPPEEADQPESAERNDFLSTIGGVVTKFQKKRQAEQGRAVLRRLNRVEFETMLRDLLDVPVRIKELLPPDGRGAGFDTVGASLNVSAVQMESYLQAIDVALDEATKLIDAPDRKTYRLSYLETNGVQQEYRRSGPFWPRKDGIAMFAPDFFSHFNSLLDHYVVPHSAKYRVKVSAYAIRTDEPITLTVRMGGPGHRESDEVPRTLLGNVPVESGDAQVFEFDQYLRRGQMFRIYPSSLRKMRFEQNTDKATGVFLARQKDYRGPAVVVQWVEVDGPIFDKWPPTSHRRLWGNVPTERIADAEPNIDPNQHLNAPPTQTAKPRLTQIPKSKRNKQTGNRNVYDPKQGYGGEKLYRRTRVRGPLQPTRRLVPVRPHEDANRLIKSFADLVFRQPTSKADIDPFVALVDRWLDDGVDFEQAMRAGYKAILTSPRFLYLHGGQPIESGSPELSNDELAERLALTFWNSVPDAELRKLARTGELNDPGVLQAQAERLMNDRRFDRFLESFLGQWLDLRLIDFTSPDSDLYPEFDPLLQWSIVEETKRFVHELIKQDLSSQNLVDSDFAIINRRLAKHYGIDGVNHTGFQRITLPPDSPRGGLLTQASVLKVTANGTTTSPVVRGKWVLERILGTPPDPPPPGIPAIEPDIRGAVTVLQQLAAHRSDQSCASCHAEIDPPGVALECFDVIGGFRHSYRMLDPDRSMDRVRYQPESPPPLRYRLGLKVECSDELSDGKAFANISEFKKLLLSDTDRIARNVVSHFVTYSTGAPVSFADRSEVERILDETRRSKHGMRRLLLSVIASRLFQRR